MAESRAHDSELEAKAFQLMDHLLDQWLILADAFKGADPALANVTLKMLDKRLDEFVDEIDPVGRDREWYETGRQFFRRMLIQRLNSFSSGQARINGFIPQD